MKNVFNDMAGPIQKAISAAGFKEPTKIQSEAIPVIIQGKDVMGIAQTGTGKTAAFVLPMLQRMVLDPRGGIRALILCPTRELAVQVADSIQTFAKNTRIKHTAIFGGVGQGPQVRALKSGVDILVATPGRLFDLHNQKHVKLGKVEFFVLDEADRMLDMGFINDIKKISKLIPEKRQTLFFSATMSGEVGKLAQTLLNNPVRLEVTPQSTPVAKIDQKVLFVDHENKVPLLLHLLKQKHLDKVLIFTKTKRGADRLCRVLKQNNISTHQIHGDRTQNQRTQALKAFSLGKVRCLVATDVAARGIDIDDISHVINYDLPMESENYIHRIGRTARAGAEGTAYSFSTTEDKPLLNAIRTAIGKDLPVMDHQFHSESAKNSQVKKVFRGRRPGPGPSRSGGSRGRGGSTRKKQKRNFARKGDTSSDSKPRDSQGSRYTKRKRGRR